MKAEVPSLVVCEHCDAVHHARALSRGEVARCMRCQAVMYRCPLLGVEGMFALAVAAGITFVIANVSPIVTLGLNGSQRSATLWQAIITAWNQGIGVVSVLVALMLFFFPLLQISLFGWVLGFLRVRRQPPGFVPIMRVLAAIHPWSMIEVFMLGTLVAVVKVQDLFDIILQPGIWAFAALTLLVPAVASFDLHRVWKLRMERCS